jgi:hypothetical protein
VAACRRDGPVASQDARPDELAGSDGIAQRQDREIIGAAVAQRGHPGGQRHLGEVAGPDQLALWVPPAQPRGVRQWRGGGVQALVPGEVHVAVNEAGQERQARGLHGRNTVGNGHLAR